MRVSWRKLEGWGHVGIELFARVLNTVNSETKYINQTHCRVTCRDPDDLNRLASPLGRAPHSWSEGREFESPADQIRVRWGQLFFNPFEVQSRPHPLFPSLCPNMIFKLMNPLSSVIASLSVYWPSCFVLKPPVFLCLAMCCVMEPWLSPRCHWCQTA